MRTDILERKEEILQWIAEEQPKNYMCKQLGCKQETLNSYLKKMGIEYAGQQSKKGQYKGGKEYLPAMYYIKNDLPIQSHKLKEKLIRDGLKRDCCEKCGISEWFGIKLPLELHHKDGNHHNNQLENLEILCPNCHSIQEGNSGANIGKYSEDIKASQREKNKCVDCGVEISYNATRCKSCAQKEKNKEKTSNRPNREELKKLIRTLPFSQIGKLFGVSDNAIRKWCDTYNLPRKVSEIKTYSDKEWEQI